MGGHRRRGLAGDESGAAIVMVAVFLVALLALSSLAVDGGLALVKRRDVRNAADHAALEASWASCHGEDPGAAADLSVANNGYDPSRLTLTSLGGHRYQAHVKTEFQTGLAGVVGKDQFNVTGVAVADCLSTPGGSGNVIWAGGDRCGPPHNPGKQQLTINGSELEVTGGVHSNGSIRIDGSDNTFYDEISHVGVFFDNGGGNSYPTPTNQLPSPPAMMWPWSPGPSPYVLSAYAMAADFYVDGDIDGAFIESRGNGLYYATGDIKMDVSDVNRVVTLVAEGQVEFSGSNQVLDPYVDDLLAFADVDWEFPDDKWCDEIGVAMNGSTNSWTGVVYAPKSLIKFEGSSNTTVNGSLIGYSVIVPGSVVDLTFAGDTGGSGFSLTLEK